ncbi:hypothetical protein J2W96_007345 [Variovorax guangxiensis]|nr:hypothetical protein [Variovorax guangxiensis]
MAAAFRDRYFRKGYFNASDAMELSGRGGVKKLLAVSVTRRGGT